jgi:uncharacterized protein (DUF433 family)
MTFEEYLDLDDPDGIRLKGHRIWLNDLLYEVVFNYRSAEELSIRFPTLMMDEVYAALLYFETHRKMCLENLTDALDASRRNIEAHAQDSRAAMERLRQRKMERAGTAGA